jgi:site-specific recombinase XerD
VQLALDLRPLPDPLIRDFLIDRQLKARAPRTLENYRRFAGQFTGWLQGREPSAPLVRAFLSEVAARGVRPATVATYACAIRALLNFLTSEGRCPQIKVPIPSLPLAPPTCAISRSGPRPDFRLSI